MTNGILVSQSSRRARIFFQNFKSMLMIRDFVLEFVVQIGGAFCWRPLIGITNSSKFVRVTVLHLY